MAAVVRRSGWLALGAALLLSPGCGRRTPPRPYEEVLPAVTRIEARQREEAILIAWREPGAAKAAKYAGLRGYVMRVERFALECAGEAARCPPEAIRELPLPRDAPALTVEGGWAYLVYTPEVPRGAWRFRVAARYRDGLSRSLASSLVRGLNAIPRHTLRWEWAASPPRKAGERRAHPAVRLSWPPRRESIVRVISNGGPPIERARFYRVNLYRRHAQGNWPMRPLNAEPLDAAFWIDTSLPSPVSAGENGPADEMEYTLRLVDQFGGEGPPAPPIRVALPAGNPK